MSETRRIAVLGLYNSGSTALAGMLHRLGVNMGPPFWITSDDNSEENFYEPYQLAMELRRWWQQPKLVEKTPAADRIRFLKAWIGQQESIRPGPVGAKHPLLSLCIADLAAAWGEDTCWLWSWRALDESIAGLVRRKWFSEADSVHVQNRLWEILSAAEGLQHRLTKLEWRRVKSDPDWGARELAHLAGLSPSEAQLRAAGAFVRRPSEQK